MTTTATTDRTFKLDAQYHLDGCPGTRTEHFETVRPAKPDEGRAAATFTVVRCLDCGGQHETKTKED